MVGRKGGEGKMFSDSGEDFWQNIPAGTYGSGQVVLTTPINISQMGAWLKPILQLYEQWKINKMVMKYRPSIGSTQAGNLRMFYDPDPTNNWAGYTPGADLVKRAFTMAGGVDFALWQSCASASPPTGWLWTQPQGSDPRLYQGGQFVVICVTGFTVASDPGALYMDWQVDARGKTYNQAAFTMTSMIVGGTGAIQQGPAQFIGEMLTSPLITGGTPVNNNPTWSWAIGAPVACLPTATSKTMYDCRGSVVITGLDAGTLALPAGEYLITVSAGTGANVPTTPAIFVSPCAEGNNWIKASDTGAVIVNRTAGSNGFESTYIVEVPDDVHSLAMPIDANNDQIIVGASTKVNRPVPMTSDWGFVDTVASWTGIGCDVLQVGIEIVEIVSAIAGALLLSAVTKPNCRMYHHTKRSIKMVTYTQSRNGLSMGVEETALLKEFLAYKKRLMLEEWAESEATGSVSASVSVVEESSEEPHSPKSEKQVAAPVQKKTLAKSPVLPLMRRASFQY